MWKPGNYKVGFTATQGSQAAFVNSGSYIYQSIPGLTLGRYQLQVDVCSRNNAYPSGGYSVQLRTSAAIIASTNQTSYPLTNGMCRAVFVSAVSDQLYNILLAATTSGQTSFDNVRLTRQSLPPERTATVTATAIANSPANCNPSSAATYRKDNNKATGICANSVISIDLGNSQTVSSLVVGGGNISGLGNISPNLNNAVLQYKNDSGSWVTALTITGTSDVKYWLAQFNFTAVTARHWRLYKTSGTIATSELRLFGHDPAPSPSPSPPTPTPTPTPAPPSPSPSPTPEPSPSPNPTPSPSPQPSPTPTPPLVELPFEVYKDSQQRLHIQGLNPGNWVYLLYGDQYRRVQALPNPDRCDLFQFWHTQRFNLYSDQGVTIYLPSGSEITVGSLIFRSAYELLR